MEGQEIVVRQLKTIKWLVALMAPGWKHQFVDPYRTAAQARLAAAGNQP